MSALDRQGMWGHDIIDTCPPSDTPRGLGRGYSLRVRA